MLEKASGHINSFSDFSIFPQGAGESPNCAIMQQDTPNTAKIEKEVIRISVNDFGTNCISELMALMCLPEIT